jgi:hypothetical protein
VQTCVENRKDSKVRRSSCFIWQLSYRSQVRPPSDFVIQSACHAAARCHHQIVDPRLVGDGSQDGAALGRGQRARSCSGGGDGWRSSGSGASWRGGGGHVGGRHAQLGAGGDGIGQQPRLGVIAGRSKQGWGVEGC